MKSRNINKAMLIGNAVDDTELLELDSGTKVARVVIATSRYWKSSDGEEKEDTQFHRVVAWDKLAEIFKELIKKGDGVYIEGRIETRKFVDSDGENKTSTEIIADEMILLQNKED
jgi:single-strand DNA-binding protein